jgi:bifunctional UDP-N-acetylglucosamine pyrophosphorylase / glucosamine-1-phosphate N-acetyltransferase
LKRMAIVLAAGQGKRMNSKLYKVLHPVCGKPMVGHVIDTLEHIHAERTIVVIGHGADAVKGYLGTRVEYALQSEQLGTGHAVLQTKEAIGLEEGVTIVICGDTPLVTAQTLEHMVELHENSGAAATILTASMEDSTGYGRIVRTDNGSVAKIVEHKDCNAEQLKISEINTGTYCFTNSKLFAALGKVGNDNTQGEYYLPDVIGIFQSEGDKVEAYRTADLTESIGVNDRVALAEAEQFMRTRLNRRHMLAGVTIIDPAQTYVEADVRIGADTVLYPGTFLRGATIIGEGCVIGPQSDLTNAVIGNEVEVKQSVLLDAVVGSGSTIGPFAYLRPGAKLGENVKIGDFVEIKNATLGDGAKVSHLSYVGDAVIGKDVNFGCGAITVNYDGFNKNLTEIGDGAFIGSNVNLIAPVKIGVNAYVVAGSTITHNVNENDLAIARERQTNKPGYAERIRSKMKTKKK